MDRVRFGRALGQGTRAATRALLQAADAVTAPDPGKAQPKPPIESAPRDAAGPRVTAEARQKIQSTRAGVRAGSRNFVQATMAPVKKASGILWLEVTGVLFGFVAFTAALEIVRFRAALHATGEDHRNLLLAVVIFLVFAFCALSNFLRASRKSRG